MRGEREKKQERHISTELKNKGKVTKEEWSKA